MYKYFLVAFIAFFCESIDSSLGMGYGTLLTPILLLMGYQPLEIIPLILLSEFITGILAALLHHQRGNVNFHTGSRESKTAVVLAICSILGTIIASYVAFSINQDIIKSYISILLIVIGFTAYITSKKRYKFSWNRIFALGLLASFNKGISGGGYGPIITGGQMLSGLDSKSAIAITSLTEGFTCLVGVITFFILNGVNIDIFLGLALLSGAIMSIPVAVNLVKIINEKSLRNYLSIAIITLGIINVLILLYPLINIQYILITPIILVFLLLLKSWVKKNNFFDLGKKYLLNKTREVE